MKLWGWKFINEIPRDLKKYVLIAAPHTSNFDFVLLIACFWAGSINGRYLIKSELNRFPFSLFLKFTGAVPVDRKNVDDKFVRQLKNILKGDDEVALLFTPEGTRSYVKRWKTGFYRIAFHGGYPVVGAYADYKTKTVKAGRVFHLSGDEKKDFGAFENYYSGVVARYPEKFNKKFR